jgi:hypothetical protein
VKVPDAREQLRLMLEQPGCHTALIQRYRTPDPVDPAVALTLARALGTLAVPDVPAGDTCAYIYRDGEAADAWLEFNLVHRGHPALAKVTLPDGRVVGILDLRPALGRAREES